MAARCAAPHRPPRMLPYLHPAYYRPPCLFYATPPRTPPLLHPVCSPSLHVFSRRAASSKQQPQRSHAVTLHRQQPPPALFQTAARCAASHIRSFSPPAAPTCSFRPSTSDNRAYLLFYTTPLRPRNSRPTPPAAHIPPAHKAPITTRAQKTAEADTNGCRPLRLSCCGWRKELPANTSCYAFLLLM